MPIQYYMRAYKTTPTTGYVDWIVNDQPDSTGAYSGYDPSELTNVTVNRIVQSKIDNFLKPLNSNDGYFFHLNSYDWIHPPTSPYATTQDVPPQITGLAAVRGYTAGLTPRDHSCMFWDETLSGWKFAYNTGGDGYTVGASIPVFTGTLSIDGYLAVGEDPALSGIIRIPNILTGISPTDAVIRGRNASNTADVDIVQIDSSNRVKLGSVTDPVYVTQELLVGDHVSHGLTSASTTGFIRLENDDGIHSRNDLDTGNLNLIETLANDILVGDSSNEGIVYNVGDGYVHTFKANDVAQVEIGSEFIRFDKNVDDPKIYQTDQTVGNGQPLIVQAQNTAGDYGGAANLISGTGITGDGVVDLSTGAFVKFRLFGDTVPIITDYTDNNTGGSDTLLNKNTTLSLNPTIRFYDDFVSILGTADNNIIINQDPISDAGNAGATFNIVAQSNSAPTGIGGNLDLSSGFGDGASNAGVVNILTGDVVRMTTNYNTIKSWVSDIVFDTTVSVPRLYQQDSTLTTCEYLTISAQSSAVALSTGGDLYLSSGAGTSYNGVLYLTNGSNNAITLSDNVATYSTAATIYLDAIAFDASVTAPIISQFSTAGTAYNLRLQAQDSTAGIAGNLELSGGVGATTHGKIQFFYNDYVIANIWSDGYGPYLDIGSAPALSGALRLDNNTAIKARNYDDDIDMYLIGTNMDGYILVGDDGYNVNIDGYNILFDTADQTEHIYFDGLKSLYVNLMGPNAYLKAENGAYIDLPGGSTTSTNNFAIDGYHVDGYVNAINLSTLCDGSNADALHTHTGTGGAGDGYHSIIVGNIGGLSNGTDGYLLTNLAEISDESFPAYVINSDSSSINRLVVSCSQIPGVGESVVVTVRVNNIDTLLSVTIDDSTLASTVGYIESNLTDNIDTVIGDYITIRFVSSASANVENIMATIKVI